VQIKSIKAYHVVQPFVDGPYRMSKGREAGCFDAVIVAITADSGLTGWGEMAPLGNFYSAAFPAGARAGACRSAISTRQPSRPAPARACPKSRRISSATIHVGWPASAG